MIAAAGLFDLAIALFHLMFWRLFGWPESLAVLDSVNRAVVQVMNIALAALFAVAGFAFLLFAHDLAVTGLGHFLLAGMSGFWVLRLVLQPVYFGWHHRLSVLFTVVLACGAALHIFALIAAIG